MGQVFRIPIPSRRGRIALVALASVLSAACSGTPPVNPLASATPAPTIAASTPARGTPTAAPTAEPTPVPTPLPADPLAVVAALVGDETATVTFSDWDRIRGSVPGPAATDPAARLALMRSLGSRAPAAGYAIAGFGGHRAAWGWDTLDLAWEATVQAGPGAPVFVLGLSPGFDLTAVLAHFRDRGFTETQRGSALVFAHPLDVADDWVNTTELAIHTTAILEDAGLMVLSSSSEELARALDRLAGTGGSTSTRAAAFPIATAALGPVDAAVVELRADLCTTLGPRDDPELVAVAAALHPWKALAAGWRTDDSGVPATRFAFVYDDPTTATADLAGRTRLAREGLMGDGRHLVDTVFRLLDTRVDGGLILLDVEPVGGLPARILQAVLRRDLPFAACG